MLGHNLDVPLQPGALVLDRYHVDRVLGRGAMATAYLARDLLWRADVVIKLLHASSRELLHALRFEFNALRRLSHPNLTRVHDLVAIAPTASPSDVPLCFYTCDPVDGRTLDRSCAGLTWARAVPALCDVLVALGALHDLGIRHGDVKPSNVIVRANGRAVLIDLGCARPLGLQAEPVVSGTPDYLAPELLRGDRVDHRADLYSFGKLVHQVTPLLEGTIPDSIARVLRRLLDPHVDRRPADVDEVLEVFGGESTARPRVLSRQGCLAGREAELARVAYLLDALLDGRAAPRVLWITGPEGVGRTRLLREIKWEAQLRCRVVEGNAGDSDAVADLLLRALREPSVASDVDSMLRALEVLSARHDPTVFVLDDVHLLDEAQAGLLAAWIRTRTAAEAVLLVVTSQQKPPVATDAIELMTLSALDQPAVLDWIGERVSPGVLTELVRSSGGYPSAIVSLLDALGRGEVTESDLCAAGGVPVSERRIASAAALPSDSREALGLLVLMDGVLGPEQLEGLCVGDDAIGALLAAGFAERDAAGWRLMRVGEGERLAASLLDEPLRRALHARIARWLSASLEASSRVRKSDLLARLAFHTARSGDADRALAIIETHADACAQAPRAWCRAARAVADMNDSVHVQRLAARLEQAAGEARPAVERLQSLASRDLTPAQRGALQHDIGACLLKLGDLPGAIRELERALAATPAGAEHAQIGYEIARCFVRQGAYREALQQVQSVVARADTPRLRADIQETAAVAYGCLGDFAEARSRLGDASALLSRVDDPRRLVRAHGSRALIEYRAGNLSEAADGYRAALQVAERHGLSDQIGTAALNYATLAHQRAEFASALSSYERGMRWAVALGQTSTETVLQFNLAKLYADLGLFDRAARMAERCIVSASRTRHVAMIGAAATVQGEVAAGQGRMEEARARFESAQSHFISIGGEREVAEIEIQMAEVALASGDTTEATRSIERARAHPGAVDARDVRLRLNLAEARASLLKGRASEALPLAENAAREAADLRQWDAEGDAHMLLAAIWQAQGAALLVRKHHARAGEVWEAAAAGLAESIREAFWSHPRRRSLPRGEPEQPLLLASRREKKLELLVDVNKRLNSSLDTQQVLTRAMDAAIELTGAERGFVLLAANKPRQKGGLHVAVARNLDREQLGRSHLKFSRAIAEQVVASGEPVVTANASDDQRFSSNRSVHAMQLQSVICVPVVSPRGMLGALYLDNRFRRGRFGSDDVDLLMAFADQVALALHNARMHADLQERNRELEHERRRVEALVQGQAAEIDRLSAAVRSTRRATPRRYDYSAIIGDSPAMNAVFDVLDRVIDTSLPVLIQGESGTGKELVARAIHDNGPRSAGPLVVVNCGAVPDALLESELFGHVKGAFTGADRDRDGLVVRARSGTLFLDELGELPLPMQVKLLRVLQEREVRPLGGAKAVPVDFRLVCATNRNLAEEVRRGSFREDLFYRVSVIDVVLPPLRDRVDDIPALAQHLLALSSERTARPPPELTRQALRKLMGFSWPGNVRQLENVLTRANVLASGTRLSASELELPDRAAPLNALRRDEYEQREMQTIADALTKLRWNVAEVARSLGIPRPTLYRKLRRYGLVRSRVRGEGPKD